jgi:hypothetical protein
MKRSKEMVRRFQAIFLLNYAQNQFIITIEDKAEEVYE